MNNDRIDQWLTATKHEQGRHPQKAHGNRGSEAAGAAVASQPSGKISRASANNAIKVFGDGRDVIDSGDLTPAERKIADQLVGDGFASKGGDQYRISAAASQARRAMVKANGGMSPQKETAFRFAMTQAQLDLDAVDAHFSLKRPGEKKDWSDTGDIANTVDQIHGALEGYRGYKVKLPDTSFNRSNKDATPSYKLHLKALKAQVGFIKSFLSGAESKFAGKGWQNPVEEIAQLAKLAKEYRAMTEGDPNYDEAATGLRWSLMK